ncbi:MAG: F0F1 ATP synthase subunit alpha, partial [Candidatus Aminicenantes bacterium]|nr:F0F1 ATP synthase subunit alpha [Candidatus Aminicenantes bacterium]
MKQVAGSLKMDLAQYRELAAFTQFGSDLDKVTIAQLERGKRLSELLKQDEGVPLSVEKQIVIIFAGTKGYLDEFPVSAISEFEEKLLVYVEKGNPGIYRKIREEKKISEELEAEMHEAIKDFVEEFRSSLEK